MNFLKKGLLALVAVSLVTISVSSAMAAELDPIPPRVPEDQLAEMKAIKPPVDITDATLIAAGKKLFMGMGTCFTCHGFEGKGDGPAGLALDPSPRNFANSEWLANRTPGELLWTLRNGSPGTAMVPFIGSPGAILTEDDAWKLISYVMSIAK